MSNRYGRRDSGRLPAPHLSDVRRAAPGTMDSLLVMNAGARERGEEALRQAAEKGERGKQPSLLTMLGHDVVLADEIIRRRDERIAQLEDQLRRYHQLVCAVTEGLRGMDELISEEQK